MEASIEIPGVKLGLVEADGVGVAPSGPELLEALDESCLRLARELPNAESVANLDSIRAVREMFRAWGVDPARYRPSGEALIRRVAQGKGLYRVSNVVDLNNLGSCEAGWPFGSYDRGRFNFPVVFRLGRAGESYEAIGKRIWALEGQPVLTDNAGPFGSPFSDSTRTMVSDATSQVLTVVFAPASVPGTSLTHAIERHAERLRKHAGATAVRTAVVIA
ncbi:MAG TPA: phenylalanine--tRNA ligase beta subunit-related protein [Chthoniobacterales bacterium]|nr:phenylalanine--tRNA ligase beta subunit-related protein [Chthoniobacterales bacterium]